jgi:4a-hydroxytetrahydrobiopterin dehydratase
MAPTRLPHGEVTATDGLDDWRVVLRALRGAFTAPSFEAGGTLVAEIAAEADRRDHHPDVSMGYPGTVRVTLTTHSAGGITELDIDFARAISALARDAGASADPSVGQTVELAIDTMDADAIRPFWEVVLGYKAQSDGSLVDPRGLGPSIWFQQMDEPRTERNRFHLDVDVPHDEADARIAATIEAGGRMVSDERARAWWVLADADGNEACICTWEDRSTS